MDRRAMSVPTPPIRSAGMIHSRSPAEARPSRKAVGQVPYPTDRFLMFSAPGGIRTPDLRYRKPALYPLSYGGEQMNIDKPSAPGGSPCQRKVSAANCRSIDSKSTNAGGGSRCRSQTHTSESYASTSDTMNCSFRGHRSFSCAAILPYFNVVSILVSGRFQPEAQNPGKASQRPQSLKFKKKSASACKRKI